MKAILNKTGVFLLTVLKHVIFTVLFIIALIYLFEFMGNLCVHIIENFSWFDWSDSPHSSILPFSTNYSIERWGIWIGIIIIAIGMVIIAVISYYINAKYAPIIAGIIAHIWFFYAIGMAYEFLNWFALIIYFIVMYITTWATIGASSFNQKN